MSRCGWIIALLWICMPSVGWSIDAQIEFSREDDGSVWVGDKVVLRLELLSDGFSFSNQRFTLPTVPGALLLQVDSSALKSTRQIGGESWQVLGYRFRLYPQREGIVEVPPIGIKFSVSAGYGKEPSEFQFATEALQVEAQLPPGVPPGEVLVSARKLEMRAEWRPQPAAEEEAKVGDAFTRTITMHAPDVPGMVLPVTTAPEVEGLAVYPADPLVNDTVDRGSLTGERTDAVTYVCEREGRHTIPAQTIRWWNPETNRREEAEIPGLDLVVAPNPALQAEPTPVGEVQLSWRTLAAISAGIAMLLVLIRSLWPRLSARWQAKRETYANSEQAAFKSLRRACRHDNAAAAYKELLCWLRRWQGLRSIGELLEHHDDFYLGEELDRLQRAVVEPQTNWSGRGLFKVLKTLRAKGDAIASQRLRKGRATLPPLNPSVQSP